VTLKRSDARLGLSQGCLAPFQGARQNHSVPGGLLPTRRDSTTGYSLAAPSGGTFRSVNYMNTLVKPQLGLNSVAASQVISSAAR